MLCRENHAPAGGRGVVFVGGPNSAAYARRGGAAGRGAGAAGAGPPGSTYSALAEGAAATGYTEKAVEGPPQVTWGCPPCSLFMLFCVSITC